MKAVLTKKRSDRGIKTSDPTAFRRRSWLWWCAALHRFLKHLFTEKGVRQGCFLYPLLICAYTEQVMREADITESGAVIGGRSISNLRYADDTALCGKNPQEINSIVHKVKYVSHYSRCISKRCTR